MIKKIKRPPTLKQIVIDRLREEICRNNFSFGKPLHEEKIAIFLNVSRGTVREALLQLKDEHLVEVIPHKGAFLTELSTHKAWEIYSLRALLEPYAARLALENKSFSSEDIEKLTSLVESLGYSDSENGLYEKLKVDMEFHEIICQGCNNELLLSTLRNLQSLTRLFIMSSNVFRSDRVKADISHGEILKAIMSGSLDKTEELIRKHIIDTGIWLEEKKKEISKRE